MKTTKHLQDYKPNFDLSDFGEIKDILFLDIETTGLSPRSSYIYMIGAAYYTGSTIMGDGGFVISQWMCENAAEEKEMLESFIEILSKYSILMHFNGNTFDIPFILERCKANNLAIDISSKTGIDIYRRISPYKHMLKLSSCKQKAIEEFLQIYREDEFSGGDLINVYKEYQKDHDLHKLKLLTTHNYEDIKGMLDILPIFAYIDMFNGEVTLKNAAIDTYKDVDGILSKELKLTLSLKHPLIRPISCNCNNCYLSAKDSVVIIKVPVYTEEMKYFYDNYKDYYYLPTEDMAIHKSVSVYVDKDFREQAKASTCYTRKTSDYLPQWSLIIEPFFKRDYNSKLLFFEVCDDFKKSFDTLELYSKHILEMMVRNI